MIAESSFVHVFLPVCPELLKHWLAEVTVRVSQLIKIKIKIQWFSCHTWICISDSIFIS